MSQLPQNNTPNTETADPRWKDLYRIGFIACTAFPVLIIISIAAYFVWPCTSGLISVADTFATLQSNRLEQWMQSKQGSRGHWNERAFRALIIQHGLEYFYLPRVCALKP